MTVVGSGKKRRIFIAIPIDIQDTTPLQPVLDILKDNTDILKNVNAQQYHITIKFLGDVEENRCKKIIEAFETINIKSSKIPYTIKGLGAFPNTKKASILWFGIKTDMDKLISIQQAIEEFSKNFEFEEEKRVFKPHITIARLRKGRKIKKDLSLYIEENCNTEFTDSVFNRITLFESILSSAGPAYNVLKTLEL